MLDDVPDKLRRNLMVYCCAILIGWYLDLDAKNFLSIPGVDFKVLDKSKISVLSLLVLLYLMLRFSHTDEYKKITKFFLQHRVMSPTAIVVFIKAAIQSYEKEGRTGLAGKVFDWKRFDEILAEMPGYRKIESIDFKIDAAKISVENLAGFGSVGLDFYQNSDAGKVVIIGPKTPKSIKFAVPIWYSRRQRLLALWKSISNEEDFVVALVPVFLAVITYFYLLVKLFSSH